MFALVLLAAPSLGAMHFPISCNKTAQADVTRGLLAVHSFWYDEAKASFERAEKHDPNCALAYAGEALSVDYLLWGYHDQESGAKALASLPAAAKMTPKERALVDAVRALFADGKARPAQVHDFEAALSRAHATYPDDDELDRKSTRL